ncbi:MAG: hypothetical protein QXD60_01470 [Nanopusillaceae archaeon]
MVEPGIVQVPRFGEGLLDFFGFLQVDEGDENLPLSLFLQEDPALFGVYEGEEVSPYFSCGG